MVKAKERTITTTTAATVDKVSLCIVITTVIIILIVVATGVCVRFLLEENLSRIILISLICFLCLFGYHSADYVRAEETGDCETYCGDS
ncbi:hypothetical protein NQ314_019046 [Rhamnusium bicolor]|uniref:Uncharacterized protein n=1 Tax=Rhamnusium bicolor TaxID=1586634 RepID=A0AAV8WPJ8_9CUCU|nr:hypothetical protein NQ314_019046 [Rhamnusium bicolor]